MFAMADEIKLFVSERNECSLICVKYIAKTTFKVIGNGEVLQIGGGAGVSRRGFLLFPSKHDESFVALSILMD
jgi:hypothetical protein